MPFQKFDSQGYPDQPLVRVVYLQANVSEVAPGRWAKEVILSGDDVRLLRLLAARNINIRLENPGQRTYHMRLHQLLKRLVPGPRRDTWCLHVSITGTLRSLPSTGAAG